MTASSHLPQGFEFPLFDPEKLAGLSADNGSVARRVVQDGLPEGRPNPQGADRDCILNTQTDVVNMQQAIYASLI